ncbi:MAG: GntR family transcriptional regulator [Verrucomicrobia bacterium]|nr:GntR family transcriptional regulator [Verrucomicrobiota bacterium]
MNLDLVVQTADPVHVQIERYLRGQIQRAALKPGARLPSSRELARKWDVDYKAVQRALKRMAADGLLERAPRRGTFVRAQTAKATVGILIGPSLLVPEHYFHRALAAALKKETGDRGWRSRLYDDLRNTNAKAVSVIIQQLIDDIRCPAEAGFKGLLWISVPPGRLKDEVLQARLPKVLLDEETIYFDIYDFTRKAVDYLAQRGCRHLFYFRSGALSGGKDTRDLDGFWDGASAHGLKVGQNSIHNLKRTEWAGRTTVESLGRDQMRALLDRWDQAGAWPDGLIVRDDVAMRGIGLALQERGAKIIAKLRIVCCASEEIQHLYAAPVVRYEFPLTEIARQMVALLWKSAAGDPLPPLPIVIRGKLADTCA